MNFLQWVIDRVRQLIGAVFQRGPFTRVRPIDPIDQVSDTNPLVNCYKQVVDDPRCEEKDRVGNPGEQMTLQRCKDRGGTHYNRGTLPNVSNCARIY